MITVAEIVSDLDVEYRRLDAILAALTPEQWRTESGAPGWTVRDVVVHLARSEAGVEVSCAASDDVAWTTRDRPLDDAIADGVASDTDEPEVVLSRWRAAAASSLAALSAADPARKVNWAAAPLLPATLATTRLAEHWTHGLDVCEPLGIEFPDTARLRHIAWLGHSTIPYGCSLQDLAPQPIRSELVGPNGEAWNFGPADAASLITGDAGEFCRVGAQRLKPADTSLVATGPFGDTALSVLRNYAA